MNYKKLFTKLFVFVLLSVSFFVISRQVKAAPVVTDVTGWAWSSNIGWVSFNCSNVPSSCASTSNYGVKFTRQTTGDHVGTLSGYAWSSSIGWISFNANDVLHLKVNINTVTGTVSGWARALTAVADPNDGWDGWISMVGTSYPTGNMSGDGGVTYNKNTGGLVGYAWGSDVVGWLKFDAATTPDKRVIITTPPASSPLSVSCNINELTLESGQSIITMNSSNLFDVSGGVPSYTYLPQIQSLSRGSNSLSVTVTDSATPQVSISRTCAVNVNPYSAQGNMWLNNNKNITNTKIKSGQTAKINWDLQGFSESNGCVAIAETGGDISGWNIEPEIKDSAYFEENNLKDNGSHFSLSGLSLGEHKLKISCADGSTNPVTITVTSSTIEER